MNELFKSLPKIIKEASSSPLGILALLITAIFVLAFTFFNGEEPIVKIIIFTPLMLGVLLFGIAVYLTQMKEKVSQVHVQNDNIRNKKIPKYLVLIITFVVMIMSYSAYYWNSNIRVHNRYYNSYIRTIEGWIGVSELNEDQIKHKNNYFKFNYKGGFSNPVSIEYLKGNIGPSQKGIDDVFAKELIKDCSSNSFLKVFLFYDKNNKIQREVFTDEFDKELLHLNYNEKKSLISFLLPTGFDCPQGNSGIDRASIEWGFNQNGKKLIKRIVYQDSDENFLHNKNGKYGLEYEYDKKGNLSSLYYLGPNLEREQLCNRYIYGNNQELIFKEVFNLKKRTLDYNRRGETKIKYQYDKYLNLVSKSFFDEDDKPIVDFDYGVHKFVYSYDVIGNMISEQYFDYFDNRMESIQGYSFELYEHDGEGNKIQVALYKSDSTRGYVTQTGYGYSKRQIVYDKFNRIVEEMYFDHNDNPMFNHKGYWKKVFTYNEDGYISSEKFYDFNSHLINGHEGWAVMYYVYDKRGNRIEARFYDKNEQPTYHKIGRYHLLKSDYDNNNNRIELAYYDINENPICNSIYGCHKKIWTYDINGRRIGSKHYDEKGELCQDLEGRYYFQKRKFDKRGNLIEESYFGINEEPINLKDDYHVFNRVFDYRGFVTEIEYKKVVDGKIKYVDEAKQKFIVNRYNYRVRTSFYDKDDNLLERSEDGFATISYQRGKFFQYTEKTYLDKYGNLINAKFPIHRREYNSDALKRSHKFFNREEEPDTTIDGVHCYKYSYYPNGKEKTTQYFGASMEIKDGIGLYGTHKALYIHNSFGLVKEVQLFDSSNQPVNGKFGYHRYVKIFDKYGNVLQRRNYDVKGKSIKSSITNSAVEKHTFDERGFRIQSSYYDEYNNPCLNKDGIHMLKEERDKIGRLVKISFFDIENNPIKNQKGCYAIRFFYDNLGYDTKDCITNLD